MSNPLIIGYEVIRDGQGMSVEHFEGGDIIIKPIYTYPGHGGPSSGGGGIAPPQAPKPKAPPSKPIPEKTISYQLGKAPPSVISPYKTYYGEDQFMKDKRWFTFDVSKEKVRQHPTKSTIISGQPSLTLGERYAAEKMAVGGYDPAEFHHQRIGKELLTKHQKIYDKDPVDIVGKQKAFEKEYMKSTSEYSMGRGRAMSFKPEVSVRTEARIAGTTAAIGIGTMVAPQTTGFILGAMGTKEAMFGFDNAYSRKEGGIRVLTGLAMMGMGTSSIFKGVEASIVRSELAQLSSKPPTFSRGIIIKGGKSDGGIITAYQTQGRLTTRYAMAGKIYSTPKGKFIMPSGKVDIRTTGELGWNLLSGRGARGRGGTYLTSVKKGDLGVKGIGFKLDEGGKYMGSVSKGMIEPKISMHTFYTKIDSRKITKQLIRSAEFGGDYIKTPTIASVSKRVKGDLYYTRSGRVEELGINLNTLTGRKEYIIDVGLKDYGRTKVIYGKTKDVKFIQGSGKTSSKQYFKQLYSPSTMPIQEELLKQSAATSTAHISRGLRKPIIRTSFKQSPIHGMGLSVKQNKGLIVSPRIKSSSRLIEKPRIKSVVSSTSALTPRRRMAQPAGVLPRERTAIKLLPKISTKFYPRQTLKPSSIFPTTFTQPRISPISPSLGIGSFGFDLPSFARRRTKPIAKKGKVKIRQTRYTPTIKARWLKQTAPIIPKTYKIGMGGISSRPLIGIGTRRKKKR